jgi:uncharacterized membrane protein
MERRYTTALAVGIGVVAGLRPMTAPAVIAWAAERRWIRLANSPLATMISARASRRITEFAISELISDKLPFTPSRLNAGPLASRIVSGAICGAAISGVVKRPLAKGAALGGLGALAGAVAGYYARKSLSRDMPKFAVAVLEDTLAIGGGVIVAALTAAAD